MEKSEKFQIQGFINSENWLKSQVLLKYNDLNTYLFIKVTGLNNDLFFKSLSWTVNTDLSLTQVYNWPKHRSFSLVMHWHEQWTLYTDLYLTQVYDWPEHGPVVQVYYWPEHRPVSQVY